MLCFVTKWPLPVGTWLTVHQMAWSRHPNNNTSEWSEQMAGPGDLATCQQNLGLGRRHWSCHREARCRECQPWGALAGIIPVPGSSWNSQIPRKFGEWEDAKFAVSASPTNRDSHRKEKLTLFPLVTLGPCILCGRYAHNAWANSLIG